MYALSMDMKCLKHLWTSLSASWAASCVQTESNLSQHKIMVCIIFKTFWQFSCTILDKVTNNFLDCVHEICFSVYLRNSTSNKVTYSLKDCVFETAFEFYSKDSMNTVPH